MAQSPLIGARRLTAFVVLAVLLIWLLAVPALASSEPRWARHAPAFAAADVGTDSVLDDDDCLDAAVVIVADDPTWPRLVVGAVVSIASPVLVRFEVDRPSESRAPPSR